MSNSNTKYSASLLQWLMLHLYRGSQGKVNRRLWKELRIEPTHTKLTLAHRFLKKCDTVLRVYVCFEFNSEKLSWNVSCFMLKCYFMWSHFFFDKSRPWPSCKSLKEKILVSNWSVTNVVGLHFQIRFILPLFYLIIADLQISKKSNRSNKKIWRASIIG